MCAAAKRESASGKVKAGKTTKRQRAANSTSEAPAASAGAQAPESPASAAPEPDYNGAGEAITIRGARTHNLKNVSCRIPRAALTVITGVSGSGKSSLAFDTLFAEGQRRYVESLSTYARQFLERLARPDVDEIDHIPPAIALEQKNSVKNARSTIGTATEINDYLRLLYARIGRIFCPDCGVEVERDTAEDAPGRLRAQGWPEGARLLVLAPVRLEQPSMFRAVAGEMRREGYTRLWIGGAAVDTTSPEARLPEEAAEFAIVVDRLVWRGGEEDRARLVAAVEQAFRLGRGQAALREAAEGGGEIALREDLACRKCGRAFRALEPQMFSFYNPIGACKTCQGFGRVTGLDMDKVIPDPTLSLNQGAIAPWNTPLGAEMYKWLRTFKKFRIPWDTPFCELSEEHRRILIEGEGEWSGVRGFFKWLEGRRYKVQARILIARYRGFATCPDCGGARLIPEALWVRVGGETLAQLWRRSVKDLRRWFREEARFTPREEETARLLLREIRARLDYLEEVGLGYLTLDRQTRTLSGGETQRINLATALGGALTETLYVLDEPTVGLHPRDTDRLIQVLRRLVNLQNTVVVVEHDLDVIRAADHLVDLGPAAGERGGQVVYEGAPGEIGRAAAAADGSQTARFLKPFFDQSAAPASANGENEKKRRKTPGIAPAPARRQPAGWITILGACENNLRHLTVEIPLGTLTCVTGVSGSGKTTLVSRCLFDNYRRMKGDPEAEPGKILRIEGLEAIGDMIFVDQTPIGRTTRSNPATYLKAWDGVRELFAGTREARRQGFTPGFFSFNVEGGRCEVCKGAGVQVIDMQFLADVEAPCEACGGKRFQENVLGVTFEGKTITDVLEMTVAEALDFFEGHGKVLRGLRPLADVGLGYLRLGQSASTLSGGEAQRMKLASHLAEAGGRSRLLLLFDEPTTGLHPADLETLMGVFFRLLEKGISLLVIEHNLELISRADWIIDLGPEGGGAGGEIVVAGPPEVVVASPASHTGRFLRTRFS